MAYRGWVLLLGSALVALAACGEEAERTQAAVAAKAASCAPLADDRVWIAGGEFMMGSDATYPEEGPAHLERVAGFWIDRHEVTNRQFAEFVDATGYVTIAERTPDISGYPDAPPEMGKPGSAVFVPPEAGAPVAPMSWWAYVPGASWRMPHGPAGAPARPDEPVVHIAHEDALAYAEWAGARLPTEAEWEYAARAGSDIRSTEQPSEANSWQGVFPVHNGADDGFAGIAPVGCFAANAWGLHDMIGNVWEWTSSDFTARHDTAPDPDAPFPTHVVKGGSFLCAPNYCMRYRPEARHAQDSGMGASHIGFRTVRDAPAPLPPSRSGTPSAS